MPEDGPVLDLAQPIGRAWSQLDASFLISNRIIINRDLAIFVKPCQNQKLRALWAGNLSTWRATFKSYAPHSFIYWSRGCLDLSQLLADISWLIMTYLQMSWKVTIDVKWNIFDDLWRSKLQVTKNHEAKSPKMFSLPVYHSIHDSDMSW